mgnify:CR=1 FL=1
MSSEYCAAEYLWVPLDTCVCCGNDYFELEALFCDHCLTSEGHHCERGGPGWYE